MENLRQQRVAVTLASAIQTAVYKTATLLRFLESPVSVVSVDADLLPPHEADGENLPQFRGGFLPGALHQLTSYTGQIQFVQEVILLGDVAYQNLCDYVRLLNDEYSTGPENHIELDLKVEDKQVPSEAGPQRDPARRIRVVHLTYTSDWQLGQVGLFFETAAQNGLRNAALKEHFQLEEGLEQ